MTIHKHEFIQQQNIPTEQGYLFKTVPAGANDSLQKFHG